MEESTGALGSSAAPSAASGLADVPADFLRQLFARLDYKDLCTAASTCRTFKQLTVDSWRSLAERRWLYGRECPRWQQAAAAGEWKRLYRERHQASQHCHHSLHKVIPSMESPSPGRLPRYQVPSTHRGGPDYSPVVTRCHPCLVTDACTLGCERPTAKRNKFLLPS